MRHTPLTFSLSLVFVGSFLVCSPARSDKEAAACITPFLNAIKTCESNFDHCKDDNIVNSALPFKQCVCAKASHTITPEEALLIGKMWSGTAVPFGVTPEDVTSLKNIKYKLGDGDLERGVTALVTDARVLNPECPA